MTETEQEYKEILNKGVEYVAKREFDRAIECFNQIPQDSTLFFQVQCLKGAAMEELRLYEAAIECFDNIPQYHDLFDYVQYLKGLILIKLNRDKEAIECFNQITECCFFFDSMHLNKGFALVGLGQTEEAIVCFDKVPKDHDFFYDAQINKGFALEDLEQTKKAIICYSRIPKQHKFFYYAQYRKGYCLGNLNKYEKAINCFDKIPKNQENYYNAQYYKGIALYRLGNLTDAAKSFVLAQVDELKVLTQFANEDEEKVNDLISLMLDENEKGFFNKTLEKHGVINPTKKDRDRYKKIYMQSLKIIVLLHVNLLEEDCVAHYTNRSVAAKLLMGDSVFRLGGVATANDPQEGKTLLKYLTLHELSDVEPKDSSHAFVGCFTFNHNSLNQFRLYGKEQGQEATGVSIVVNRSFFSQQIGLSLLDAPKGKQDKTDMQKHALYRCIYLDSQTKKVISLGHREDYAFFREKPEVTFDEISTYKDKIKDCMKNVETGLTDLMDSLTSEKKQDLKDSIILDLLLSLRYLVKHFAFKEEQECRVLDIENPYDTTKKIEYEACYSQMYINYLKMDKTNVDKVYFAPKANGMHVLKQALKTEKYWDLIFEKSDHPFN